MDFLVIDAPGSASSRQRRVVRILMWAAVLSLIPIVMFRTAKLPEISGIVVFFIGVITVVQGIAAYLFFDQARITGQRTYLFIAAGCEFVALMGVVWAATSTDAVHVEAVLGGSAAVGAMVRMSLGVVSCLCLGVSAVVYRGDRRRRRRMPAVPVGRTALGVAVVAVVWVAGLFAIQDSLPRLSVQGPTGGTYTPSLWAITALAVISIMMVVPSYLTHSALHTWLMLALVLITVALACGVLTVASFTVTWYATYLYLIVATGSLLVLLLDELRRMDRRRRTALTELEEIRQSADATNVELSAQVMTDSLTGLSNRAHFFSELSMLVDRVCIIDADHRLAVVVIDFDGFKAINDRWGHAAGDQVLRELGDRMLRHTRQDDLVSRIGGDEFGMAFPLTGGTDFIADRLCSLMAQLHRPIVEDGARLSPRSSVGYCVAPDDGTDPDDLYRKADRATYQAKRDARGMAVAYSASMTAKSERERLVRADAIRSLSEHRLSLAYQPILDLTRGGVWGFEALLRMTKDDGTVVPACEFVEAMVAGGQVHLLGSAVMDQLVQDIPMITTSTPARMTFNLSAPELADHSLMDRLLVGDLTPFAGRLVVEVTEETISAPGVAGVLADLRSVGVTIAVDDFGTGRSNMAMLQQTRPGLIKVDGEFVSRLSDNESGAAVIRAAVSLASGLHSLVVAEGVETPDQASALPALGVHLGQGYGLGRPLAPMRPAAPATVSRTPLRG